MTERQKTLLWRKVQTRRDRFASVMTKKWFDALMALIDPILREMRELALSGLSERVPVLMTDEPVVEQWEFNATTVALFFAKDTWGDIEKAMGEGWVTKQGDIPTDEEWLARIMSLLTTIGGDRITAIMGESKLKAQEIIKAVLTQAAEDGLGVSQTSILLRDQLTKQWGDISTYRAARIARTETISAGNLGSLVGAKETGEPMLKVWLSTRDGRTRRRGRRQRFDHYGTFPTGPDGEKVEMDEKFVKTGEAMDHPGDYSGSAGNVINCYTGDMSIKSPIISAQKLNYSGKIVKIITSGGKRLTVTPNHGVLTMRGFIKASSINDTDELICDGKYINNSNIINSHNINDKKTLIRNVFNTLYSLFRSQVLPVRHLDFNGDGKFMDGNINIVDTNIKLSFNSKILVKDVGDFRFKQSRSKATLVKRFCSLELGVNGLRTTSNSVVRFLHLIFPFAFRHLTPFKFFGIGLGSHHYTLFNEIPIKGDPLYARKLRKFIKANTGHVHFDKVSKVGDYDFSGHVYDFTSLAGVNIVNNIYTSNCRCTQYYEPKTIDEA